MGRRKLDKRILIAAAGVLVVLIALALVLNKGKSLFGSAVPAEPNDFPEINVPSGPDNSNVQRPVWSAIALKAAVCADFTIYHTNKTGNWELFRLGDIPGNANAPLNISQGNKANVQNLAPSRSPDSQWVAFTSNRDGNWEIYVAAIDGSDQRRVTYNSTAADIDPMWSPNGRYIAYETTRYGSRDLAMIDVTTGEESRLTDSPGNDVNVYWSPDSKKVLYQSDSSGLWQLYMMDITSKQVTTLSDGKGNDLNPQFSADGKYIVFRSYRDNMQKSLLFLANVDGSGSKAISDPNGNATTQVWSPDSSMIAYQSDITGNGDIYVYQVATGKTSQITKNNAADFAPTWRCNSSTLIFTSKDDNGKAKLYQVDLSNGGASESEIKQLTFGDSNDQYPLNSPSVEDGSRRGKIGNP